jgi:hypothetical protein
MFGEIWCLSLCKPLSPHQKLNSVVISKEIYRLRNPFYDIIAKIKNNKDKSNNLQFLMMPIGLGPSDFFFGRHFSFFTANIKVKPIESLEKV